MQIEVILLEENAGFTVGSFGKRNFCCSCLHPRSHQEMSRHAWGLATDPFGAFRVSTVSLPKFFVRWLVGLPDCLGQVRVGVKGNRAALFVERQRSVCHRLDAATQRPGPGRAVRGEAGAGQGARRGWGGRDVCCRLSRGWFATAARCQCHACCHKDQVFSHQVRPIVIFACLPGSMLDSAQAFNNCQGS